MLDGDKNEEDDYEIMKKLGFFFPHAMRHEWQ